MLSINVIDIIPQFFKNQYYKVVNYNLLDKYGLKVWRNNFIKVGCNTNDFNKEILNKIAYSRASTRLYYSLFYNYKSLTIESLALMIAMETLDFNLKIEKENVIQLAYAIRNSWFEEVLEDKTLNERFKIKSGKSVFEIKNLNEGLSDSNLFNILSDQKSIRKSFFNSYSVKDGYEKVRVFFPNINGYIDWKKENSVDVLVNSFKCIELGFFRIGYDYELLTNDRYAWVVTLTKDNRHESVIFGDKRIGGITDKYIWGR